MKKLLALFVCISGCAHMQHANTPYDHRLIRWCEARPITVNIWGDLAANERAAVAEAVRLWTQATVRSGDLNTTRRRVELIASDRFADIAVSRNGGDWGDTELAYNLEDGCLLHAHVEIGQSLDSLGEQVLLRAITHEIGHALGLVDSYVPEDIMQSGYMVSVAP